MNKDLLNDLKLIDELQTSVNLIELGLKEYENVHNNDSFYFLPFILISNGFERFMKCYCCLAFYHEYQKYPDYKTLKSYGGSSGHNLIDLKFHILNNFFSIGKRSALSDDYKFLQNDKALNKLLQLLSDFGESDRYHNLSTITSDKKPTKDIKQLWQEYELEIIRSDTNLSQKFLDNITSDEVIGIVKKQIIGVLERFVRALSRQFTLGELRDKAKQFSPHLYRFLTLRDSELGIKQDSY